MLLVQTQLFDVLTCFYTSVLFSTTDEIRIVLEKKKKKMSAKFVGYCFCRKLHPAIDLAKPSVVFTTNLRAHISLVSQEQRNEFVKTLYDTGRYEIESCNGLYLRRHLSSSTCRGRQYRQFVKERTTTQVQRSTRSLA